MNKCDCVLVYGCEWIYVEISAYMSMCVCVQLCLWLLSRVILIFVCIFMYGGESVCSCGFVSRTRAV